MYRKTEFDDQLWKPYLDSIESSFCPYLKKSSELGLTKYTEYDLTNFSNWEELSFSYALIHAEILREERFKKNDAKKILLCENLIFKKGKIGIIEREMFFQWTHWALKTLYTKKGLLFGKFWPEENIQSASGKLIPDPPLIFLSIRSTVGVADAKFFNLAPKLMDSHRSAVDDNESVFRSERLTNISRLLKNSLSQSKEESDVLELAFRLASQNPLKSVIYEYGIQYL